MDPVVKEKWLAELRKPEAKQTRSVLGEANGGRCCLGVLCDIAVEEGVIERRLRVSITGSEIYDYGSLTEFHAGREERTILPPSVVTWAGLDDYNPAVFYGDPTEDGLSKYALSELNDDEELSFREIADIIEEQL